jgi:uncharacterized protein YndB with AHSA1/START domain
MKPRSVNVEIVIESEPQAVFDALTDSAQVMLWWRSPDFYEVTDFHFERRKGGSWHMAARGSNGKAFTVKGSVLEYEAPTRLTFTWNPDWQDIEPTTVEITLRLVPAGVHLRLIHSGFAHDKPGYESHLHGWPHVIRWLSAFVTER